jgi:hypothetical protein
MEAEKFVQSHQSFVDFAEDSVAVPVADSAAAAVAAVVAVAVGIHVNSDVGDQAVENLDTGLAGAVEFDHSLAGYTNDVRSDRYGIVELLDQSRERR